MSVKYYCGTKNMVDVGNARRAQYGLERRIRRMHNNVHMASLEALVFINADIITATLHNKTRFDHEEWREEWIEAVEDENNTVFGTKLKPRHLTMKMIRRSINGNHRNHRLVEYKRDRSKQIECKYCRKILKKRQMTTWMCDTCDVLGQPVGFCSARRPCFRLWPLHGGAGQDQQASESTNETDEDEVGDGGHSSDVESDGHSPLDMQFLNDHDLNESDTWSSFCDDEGDEDVDEDGWPNSWNQGSVDDADNDSDESDDESEDDFEQMSEFLTDSEDNSNVSLSDDGHVVPRAARFEADDEIELKDLRFEWHSEEHLALLTDRPIYPWKELNGDQAPKVNKLRKGEIDELLVSSGYAPPISKFFETVMRDVLRRDPRSLQDNCGIDADSKLITIDEADSEDDVFRALSDMCDIESTFENHIERQDISGCDEESSDGADITFETENDLRSIDQCYVHLLFGNVTSDSSDEDAPRPSYAEWIRDEAVHTRHLTPWLLSFFETNKVRCADDMDLFAALRSDGCFTGDVSKYDDQLFFRALEHISQENERISYDAPPAVSFI